MLQAETKPLDETQRFDGPHTTTDLRGDDTLLRPLDDVLDIMVVF